MSVDVGRCFPRPLSRRKKNPPCPVKGCKRSTRTGEEYCHHHSNTCECGARITPIALKCRVCSDKATKGTQTNGLFQKPTKKLNSREQIESMIEAYQDRIAQNHEDTEFYKNRVAELQHQLGLMA